MRHAEHVKAHPIEERVYIEELNLRYRGKLNLSDMSPMQAIQLAYVLSERKGIGGDIARIERYIRAYKRRYGEEKAVSIVHKYAREKKIQ